MPAAGAVSDTSGACAGTVTATLSTTAVVNWVASALATASPTYTVELLSVIVPIVVQVTPLLDCDPVSRVPRRSNRTQYGGVTAVPSVATRIAPVVCRWWNALPGHPADEHQAVRRVSIQRLANHHARFAPCLSVLHRNHPRPDVDVTADLAVGEVEPVRRAADLAGTFERILPVPLAYCVDPATEGPPMSEAVHPAGNPPVTVTERDAEVVMAPALSRARAVNQYVPAGAPLQITLYGLVVSEPINAMPA